MMTAQMGINTILAEDSRAKQAWPDFLLQTGDFFDYARGERHFARLYPYSARQNTLAGMKPNCAVLNPMTQMMALFAEATIHPCHMRRPTRTVERTVSRQER